MDNLLVVSGGGKSVTLAIMRRDRELGIPVPRVNAGRLDEPGLKTPILTWAKSLLDAA